MAGQGEPAVAQPVAVVGDGEPAGLLGERFLALQGLELVFFGDLGGDHFEDPVREPAQRDRVVLPGQADQVGLGVAAVLDRQRVDTLDDHHRLLLGDLPGGHRVPDRLVVVVQGVRELQAALGVPFGLPGRVGPVGCRCRWRRPRAEVEAVGLVGDAELELGDLGAAARPGRSGCRPARSVARDHSPRSASWSRSAWNRGDADVTGCASGSPNTVAIQGILASSTDSPGPGMGYFGQLWRSISKACWSLRCRWSRHPLAGARCSTSGAPPQ